MSHREAEEKLKRPGQVQKTTKNKKVNSDRNKQPVRLKQEIINYNIQM